ncbi:Myozenin-1 Calsarcin-2 [Takifugu flavidus]|uniref:Myozenin-1 Calsarcin-2 n=1 Tax=Takifugu flavidus TaxID=433684 RepID=A0A5C6PFN1_9TELE|nr:Myozenin-1 Calsarcin-2 [Takifugu flavidus]
MPMGTPAPLHKRKKPPKIITDLTHITQDEYESEPEASEFDLGKKIKTPKEIMLEELSLMKNRGSKMFKMRQKRVEKFIYENNPDIFTSESMGYILEEGLLCPLQSLEAKEREQKEKEEQEGREKATLKRREKEKEVEGAPH